MAAAPPELALPQEGDLLAGKYRVHHAIAVGGMGAVFAAHHEVLDKRIAIKVLRDTAAKDNAAVARFLREAKAAAKLQSEHVTHVMDAGTLDGGLPFLVMEYLEGCDLIELLKLTGPLPPRDVCDYVIQALEAIGQAHAAGIVHRDLKPSNLFLALRADGSKLVKVLDFGISKTLTEEGHGIITGNTVLGSPAYMAPEQVRNAKGVDTRADIWSLGVVMYELLSGALPFDGDGVGEILSAILAEDPRPLRELRAEIPEGLERVVFKCLRRPRDERYASSLDLVEALAPYASEEGKKLAAAMAEADARAREKVSSGSVVVAPGVASFEVPPTPSQRDRPAATSAPAPPEAVTASYRLPRRRRGALVAAVGVTALACAIVILALVKMKAQPPAIAPSAVPVASAPPPVVVPPPPSPSPSPAPVDLDDPQPGGSPSASARPRATTRVPQPQPTGARPSILKSRD